MKVQFTVNNYTLGAKVKTTPTHKIVEKNKIDKTHTVIVYDEISERELQFIEKVLSYKGKVL
jgi:hypothetical protein